MGDRVAGTVLQLRRDAGNHVAGAALGQQAIRPRLCAPGQVRPHPYAAQHRGGLCDFDVGPVAVLCARLAHVGRGRGQPGCHRHHVRGAQL
ncbi:hypothetical protein G6F58_013391 [Rhizopus delemar]|nr:hypothetical protein G6F58_013391 [Rhizopus delemar]